MKQKVLHIFVCYLFRLTIFDVLDEFEHQIYPDTLSVKE